MSIISVSSGSDTEAPAFLSMTDDPLIDLVRSMMCQACQRWMAPHEILSCLCRLTCVDCAGGNSECDQCGYRMTSDERVVQLHLRLSRVIPHPCRYSRYDCPVQVAPGDTHEKTCSYYPVCCKCCKILIPHIKLTPHLNFHNPKKCMLTAKNELVLRSQFIDLQPSPGAQDINATIHCAAREQSFWIDLKRRSFNDNMIFSINPIFIDKNLTVTVKFDFKLDQYSYSDSIKIDDTENNSVSINKQIADDWLSGRCKLEIVVKTHTKRKRSTSQGTQE